MGPYTELVIANIKSFICDMLFSSLKRKYHNKIKLGIVQESIDVTDSGENRPSLKWWNSRKRKYIVAELTYIPNSCTLVYRTPSDNNNNSTHQLMFDVINHLSISMNVVFKSMFFDDYEKEESQETYLVYEEFQDPT